MIEVSESFSSRNAERSKKPIYLIEIDQYDKVFTNRAVPAQTDPPAANWLVGIDDQSINISELDGGSDLGELTFTVQDRQGAITADFPSFTFEGKRIQLKTGFSGMDLADYAVLFTGFIRSVDSANENNDYAFTCADNSEKLSQVIFTTGDSGNPTDSDNPFNFQGNPLDILEEILSEQLGYPDEEIDYEVMDAYSSGIFAGLQFVFKITSPPAAKDFIENELLKPLGGYLFTRASGQISVNFIYPLVKESAGSLTRDHIIGIPEAKQTDLINTVCYRFDKNDDSSGSSADSSGFLSESVQVYDLSVAKYGQYGQQVIESEGVRSGFQGFSIAALVARLIFFRYGLKNLMFEELQAIWSQLAFEPGDIVDLTHDKVPDRDLGIMGISAKKFIIFDKQLNFTEGQLTYRMLDAGFIANLGKYLITPDDQADFTAATADEKSSYMFLSGNDDKYSDGSAGNVLG